MECFLILCPLTPSFLPSLPPFCSNNFMKTISTHTTHFSHLKRTDPWFSVYSHSRSAITTVNSRTFSSLHRESPSLLAIVPHSPLPSAPRPRQLPCLLCFCSDCWASAMVAFSLWCMRMMWLPRSPRVFVHQGFRNHHVTLSILQVQGWLSPTKPSLSPPVLLVRAPQPPKPECSSSGSLTLAPQQPPLTVKPWCVKHHYNHSSQLLFLSIYVLTYLFILTLT